MTMFVKLALIVLMVLSATGLGQVYAQERAPKAPVKAQVPAAAVAAPVPEVTPSPGPKIDEMDALRIGKLWAERQALSSAYDKAVAQQELLKIHMSKLEVDFKAKSEALAAVVRDAATKAKLKSEEGWKPNLDQGVWVKD